MEKSQLPDNDPEYTIYIRDEKQIFRRSPDTCTQLLSLGQVAHVAVQWDQFQKKAKLCVWQNSEGPPHWELILCGGIEDRIMLAEQLE